ncbi:MAG: peptidoglycan-binding protein [Proteobacteria bacterium]|nr:peptidoglycan-binding protein [Pseudomonadota bacterium]
MSIYMSRSHKLLAGVGAVALVVGGMASIRAEAANPSVPQQQASLPPLPPAANAPGLPLGHDDVRETQNQLIALGFNPGPADGEIGAATNAAAQQYDQSRGGSGQVAVDSALLARLKADKGPRLTYEQVAERSRQQAQPAVQASAPASGANQIGSIVQTIAPLIGAAIANSNNNNYGPGYYGNGYYGQGPTYYGPPPAYYRGYGYGPF